MVHTREWLSGRASPCQGERREFESRLPLQLNKRRAPRLLFSIDALRSNSKNNEGLDALSCFQVRRHSQEVRQRSAKPLFPGSNPGGASTSERTLLRSNFLFHKKLSTTLRQFLLCHKKARLHCLCPCKRGHNVNTELPPFCGIAPAAL